MAEPGHVATDEVDHIVLLIRPFAWDHVRKEALRLVASHDEALDYDAFLPVLEEFGLALRSLAVLELVVRLQASSRDVPVINANPRHCVLNLGVRAVWLTQAASHDALSAPRAIGEV